MPHPFLGLGFNSWSQKFSRGNVSVAAAFLQYVTTSISSFTLRSTGTVDYEVNWGDGSTESLTTNAPTHTYSSAGEYTIKITPAEGSTYRPHFNNAVSDTSIASVSGTGGSQLGTNLQEAWKGATNMTSFSSNIDTSNVTSFRETWMDCASLTSFPLIDTSSGTNFIDAWQACSSLTSFPLIDTSSANNLGNAWRRCSSLTSFPLIDTSSANYLSRTWERCSSLTSFPLIDTSSAIDFRATWKTCTSLTSFPLIDTSSVTNFRDTWKECSSLTSFPALDFSSAREFPNCWEDCSSLITFPANMFDSTGSLYGHAFTSAWKDCALNVQSIENILVSLDTNGTSNITLGIDGGTNAAKSTWSTAANTAYTNLVNKGWTISYNA